MNSIALQYNGHLLVIDHHIWIGFLVTPLSSSYRSIDSHIHNHITLKSESISTKLVLDQCTPTKPVFTYWPWRLQFIRSLARLGLMATLTIEGESQLYYACCFLFRMNWSLFHMIKSLPRSINTIIDHSLHHFIGSSYFMCRFHWFLFCSSPSWLL